MKLIASLLSISLTAATMLPAAAADTSDRASWIESALAGNQSATKKTSTSSASKSTSITSTGGTSLARSVASLYPGVKMRPFVANRYLPSEHDIEAAQQAQAAAQTTAQLPASTVQLAKAMATTQAMNIQQHQLQGNVSYSGGYYNTMANTQARPRMTSLQSRVNALAPSIPEPITNNETVGQIRSALRSNGGQQMVASSNLYPDVVGPVPTLANPSPVKGAPSPLSFLSSKSTRQFSNSGTRTTASNASLSQASLGGWRSVQGSTQGKPSNLTYGGFQTYTGKLHTQGITSARSNGQSNKVSSLPADYSIASADTAAHVSSYTPYTSSQSSSLPY